MSFRQLVFEVDERIFFLQKFEKFAFAKTFSGYHVLQDFCDEQGIFRVLIFFCDNLLGVLDIFERHFSDVEVFYAAPLSNRIDNLAKSARICRILVLDSSIMQGIVSLAPQYDTVLRSDISRELAVQFDKSSEILPV